MAVTGVNEYTNTYAASNSASTKGSGGLSETAQDYLSELRQKYSDVNITVADFSNLEQRKAYMFSSSGSNNIAISSNIVEKMATDPAAAAKYEKVIAEVPGLGERFKKEIEAMGGEQIASGTVIDKNGKVTYWGISKAKPVENPGTVYKEKVQKQLEEKRAKKKEEERLQEKRLEQAETAEQLLEKLKADSQTETAEDIAITATKISEEGKGTQVDYTI